MKCCGEVIDSVYYRCNSDAKTVKVTSGGYKLITDMCDMHKRYFVKLHPSWKIVPEKAVS